MSLKEIVMLDQRIVSLMQELPNHPAMYERMKQAEIEGQRAAESIFYLKQGEEIPLIQSFEQGIGFIAAELGIIMDGNYTHEDICFLCDKMRNTLIEKRAIIIGDLPTKHKKLDREVIQSDYKH